MFPEIHFFNLIIPMYPLCVATGFLIGTIFLYFRANKYGFSEKLIFPLMCFAEAGVIIGGKILFLLINFRLLPKYYSSVGIFGLFTKTGFVFYGGLFGGIFTIWIFSKIYTASFFESLSLVCSVTPLVHALGRIGCFCAGCCYGIEYEGFCSVYIHGANRFPVQLLEASLLLVLFDVIQILLRSAKKSIVLVYFLGYGLIRFFCEFLRGDEARGFIGGLSVSMWISILCIMFGSIFTIYKLIKLDKKYNK